METREDMENELQSLLQVANNSALFPSARLTELIQNAHRWATNLYAWQALVRAKKTTTTAPSDENGSYYDYPEEFRTGTIIRVEIDDLEYNRKNFEDFLDYRTKYPSSTKRLFSQYARQFFVFPNTSVGATENNMSVWGCIQAPELSASSSETIFSNNHEDGNEAIVRKAFSVAVRRIDKELAVQEESIAKGMLVELFRQEQESTQRDQRIQHPKFEVPDYFGGRDQSPIGRFEYDPTEVY